ncbi:MAG TPA: hypothetical protein VFD49_09360, partial [Candidatus Dormibacteraeota bacterium]|nr:hypothetical protein [Candidatus Dormibacteraeota bacterium]
MLSFLAFAGRGPRARPDHHREKRRQPPPEGGGFRFWSTTKVKMTGGEIVLEALRREGVELIFGY